MGGAPFSAARAGPAAASTPAARLASPVGTVAALTTPAPGKLVLVMHVSLITCSIVKQV